MTTERDGDLTEWEAALREAIRAELDDRHVSGDNLLEVSWAGNRAVFRQGSSGKVTLQVRDPEQEAWWRTPAAALAVDVVARYLEVLRGSGPLS
jgi:hypothetical protein